MIFRQLSSVFWVATFAALASLLVANAASGISLSTRDRADQGSVHGELLVKLRDAVTPAEAAALHDSLGMEVVRQYRMVPNFYHLRAQGGRSADRSFEEYKRSPLVERLSHNHLHSVKDLGASSDPYFQAEAQWGLHNEGFGDGAFDADIDAPEAWDIRHDASDVIVAVVDTGVRYDHEDLAMNMWVNPGEIPNNGIDDDNNGYVDDVHGINAENGTGDPMDDNGHGTHVAGILGAVGDNQKGVSGVAWDVQIMALKFLDSNSKGSDADAIECIEYALLNGATIINNSWGDSSDSSQVSLWIEIAEEMGVFFVAAAGNSGNNNEDLPVFPASFDLDNIVSVTWTNSKDELSNNANFGEVTVDLAAPGVSIYSTDNETVSSYRVLSGSSMAAPFVSGALALIISEFPEEPMSKTLQRLYSATDRLGDLARRCRTGGRLNLARALQPGEPIPLNNEFAQATYLEGPFAKSSSFNDTATFENGEPVHFADASNKSVWWSWRAPESGFVKVSSAGSDFRTGIAVYRGPLVESLDKVASGVGDESADGAEVSFEAEEGVDYFIAVDGYDGEVGNISLNVGQTVANDDFKNRAVLDGLNIRVESNNSLASSEAGESARAFSQPFRSLWWTWTAPIDGQVFLTTASSNSFDTLLGVYQGEHLEDLVEIAVSDDAFPRPGIHSEIELEVVKGQQYEIVVDGWNLNLAGGVSGDVALTITEGGNDDFSKARIRIVDTFQDVAYSVFASKEVGEPEHAENEGGKSLWWKWKATRTGPAFVNTFGSDYDTTLAVYEGDSVAALSLIGQDDDSGGLGSRVLFDAQLGTVYRIAVDGYRNRDLYPDNGDEKYDNFFGVVRVEAGIDEIPILGIPVIAEPENAVATFGQAYEHEINASWSPVGYAATGLPEGLSVDPQSGVLTGAPSQAGNFDIVFEAVNESGTGRLLVPFEVLSTSELPVFETVLADRKVAVGDGTILSAEASGSDDLSYQWYKDGQSISGADDSTFEIESFDENQAGQYRVEVSNSFGSILSDTFELGILSESLLNISTRGYVGAGPQKMVAGFVIDGDVPRQILIRAVGPQLGSWGLQGTLADPVLELLGSSGLINTVDNWGDALNKAELESVSDTAGAFPLDSDFEAVMLITLDPGSYTARVSGANGANGLAIVEVYDLENNASIATRLANISTRLYAQSSGAPVTGGFVITGTESKQVLVRASSDYLGELGFGDTMEDPYLELLDGSQQLIAVNDDWGMGDVDSLEAAFENAGAFAFTAGSADAALLINLAPGQYTTRVTDFEGRAGLVLFEVYELE